MIGLSESLLSFSEACKLLPRRRAGRKVSPSTIYRWVRHGVRGVRLEAVAAGGGLVTSREALERFFQALTAARMSPTSAPPDGTLAAKHAATTEQADRVFGPRATQHPVDNVST